MHNTIRDLHKYKYLYAIIKPVMDCSLRSTGDTKILPQSLRPRVTLRFHPRESHFPVESDRDQKVVHCSRCEIPGFMLGDHRYTFVEYKFTYTANGAIGCGYCCLPRAECLGYHEGDVEKLIMLMDETNRISKVYFKAHGRGQGIWRDASQCEFDDHGNLVAYVARESHAFYPSPGIKWRAYGFANDLCSRRGPEYTAVPRDEHDDYYDPPRMSITKFRMLCCLPCM